MALAVIGIIANVAKVAMMIPGLVPEKVDHDTVVRVAAGLSQSESDTTSGNQPGIKLYDIIGRPIGSTKGKKNIIQDGSFIDIKVPFKKGVGYKPSEYISVANGGDDALCVAYLALTQPDGTKKAWYGDVGKTCGADWYHSLLKTGDDDYQPACIWIDRNRSNGLRYQGFGIHINDFAATKERAQQYSDNKDLMCRAAPRFRMYESITSEDDIPYFNPPLEYVGKNLTDKDPEAVLDKKNWVLPQEGPNINKAVVDADPKKKRLARRRSAPVTSEDEKEPVLIISSSVHHSAKELCESATSWGHDFVSRNEKLFCDMDTKTLWPLCSSIKKTGCFDSKTKTMRPGAGFRRRDTASGLVPPKKSYGEIQDWDQH